MRSSFKTAPQDEYLCPFKDCGRSLVSEEQLKAHITRRHAKTPQIAQALA